MSYKNKSVNQIISEGISRKDIQLLREINENEKVFHLIKKFINTPGNGYHNLENLLYKSLKKDIEITKR